MVIVELNPLALLIWLLARGLYLWVLVPVGAVAGVLVFPLLYRRGVAISQVITWLDCTMMAVFFHSVFRPLKNSTEVPWVPLSDLPKMRRFDLFGLQKTTGLDDHGLDRRFRMDSVR